MAGDPRTPLWIGCEALLALSQERIASWDDPSIAAERVREVIDTDAEIILRMVKWKCGRVVKTIAAANIPHEGYANGYVIGADIVRVWKVTPEVKWERRDEHLMANGGDSIQIEAVRWPPANAWARELGRAIALAVADTLADKFGKDDAEQARISRKAKAALIRARVINAGEGTPPSDQPMHFVNVRV